ncbi:hypothetical protein M426DRAFT_319675 [Hypoxylon sp. CI-4A]|nr:hypothetical protein M426DRAFT_319675 [Hypoxylon sp. CI-4A]
MGAMKDKDGDPSANTSSIPKFQHRLSTARSSHSYGSYEAGEPSTTTSLSDPSSGPRTLDHSPRRRTDESSSSPYAPDHGDGDLNHEVQKRRRSHKPRSSGGFLLSNNGFDESSRGMSSGRDNGRRRSRIPVDNRKGKSPLRISDRQDEGDVSRTGLGIDQKDFRRLSGERTGRMLSPAPDGERRHSQDGRGISRIPTPTPRQSTAPLDVDSTQIVNMALNLSESRRLAERRNLSSPIPPRLAHLPDGQAGGSLKQHLQQQRRTSRTMSPKPDKTFTPRAVSTPKMPTALPSFENDGSYIYHPSPSTLNRAQKAKDYLELMAQYRRLLQIVPPLKDDARSRPSSSSLSTSPTSSKPPVNPITGSAQIVLGREYNPLQYIRNRKVRGRERKTIDGDAQGFSDVSRVSGWIDETAATAATSALTPGASPIAPFRSADENYEYGLPVSNIPRPVSTVGKSKRIRMDWNIEPADMLADAYWLEQGNNKQLIEDRHYAKIFPPKVEARSQASYQANDPVTSGLSIASPREGDAGEIIAAPEAGFVSPTRIETDTPPVSARDRARQKLQDIRGIHHKQNGAPHSHHDLLRFRKGSLSDTSDSESDRKRRNRTGTISANGTDLLEKQMMDMLAQEAADEEQKEKEKEALDEFDRRHLKQLPSRMATPDNTSYTPEPLHSRRGSRIDIIETQDKAARGRVPIISPIGSGRPSLEVPGQNPRFSTDLDSSRPVSPEIRPTRLGNNHIPTIGMDLSPPESRPESPARKPFSRVKSIFRDRSRERDRGNENAAREKDDRVESPVEQPEVPSLSALVVENSQSPDRRRSKSLTRKIIPRTTNESHKSHRSMGSIKIKGDEQAGLRGLFKGGAKLDGMIRGGVSKVTDLLWKKDSDSEDSSSSSSDDSEDESKRGRTMESTTVSRSSSQRARESNRQKNYLDVMPPFKPTGPSHEKRESEDVDPLALTTSMSPPSRSPRFERLKPPRIDIRKASPPSTELERTKSRLLEEPEVSDAESRSRDSTTYGDKQRTTSKDLVEIPILPAPQHRPPIGPRTLSQGARHWSIINRSPSPQATQQISRREVARLRALILCSGIKAMEISRRAQEPHPLFALDNKSAGLPWTDVSHFVPNKDKYAKLLVPETQLYPATARLLADTIDRSIALSEDSTARFAVETAPKLQHRVELLHDRVGGDLMEMTHRAADEADDVNSDLLDGQRLKVKTVVDTMDKMLRRRRRRFRWARRAGWLAVEWVLVGFMWYVWFVVMMARIVFGVGRGVVGVVRWLLWL